MNFGLPERSLLSAKIGAVREHGDRLRYMAGCHCFKCRRANSDYERERQKARRSGDWNGIVPADKARSHIRKLSQRGVGRRAVAAASDVPPSVIQAIGNGSKPRIRARTERKLLAVNAACRSDHAYVSAAPTWRYIELLLDEGFTKTQIAHHLGKRALQFSRARVLARTAAAVERLYRRFSR